jgi:ketosteroid isomerase-like protein
MEQLLVTNEKIATNVGPAYIDIAYERMGDPVARPGTRGVCEEAMDTKSIEIIAELYAALARRDLPAIMKLIDPEIIVWQIPLLPWGGEYHGIEGVQQFFGQLFRLVDSQLSVEEFIDTGDRVIVIGWARGQVKATGVVRAVHVWTVKGGRGARFEPNVDTPKMVEVLKHNEVIRSSGAA